MFVIHKLNMWLSIKFCLAVVLDQFLKPLASIIIIMTIVIATSIKARKGHAQQRQTKQQGDMHKQPSSLKSGIGCSNNFVILMIITSVSCGEKIEGWLHISI